eukprot:3766940-Rhodomonas_salina.1
MTALQPFMDAVLTVLVGEFGAGEGGACVTCADPRASARHSAVPSPTLSSVAEVPSPTVA